MRIGYRTVLGVGVLLLLGAFVFLARSYQSTRAEPGGESEGSVSVAVTNGADRGPGSLREALFVAAGARGSATILIRVGRVAVETALPPLVNAHGVTITAQAPGATIDAHALAGGAVFDVAGANASITGVTVRNCPDSAVLLHAGRFRLMSSTIESCDVGVDVAENASDFLLERNRLIRNRIGVRLAATNRNATLVRNEFAENSDAGVWAVRGALDLRKEAPIIVRSNKFDADRAGIVAGNVSLLIEDNDLTRPREAAVHLVGAGAVIRGNRVRDGAAMGIVAENARDAVIEKNELDHLAAYAIMVRGSASVLIRANRIHNCGYGMAFVLGDEAHPSTADDNSLVALRHYGIDVIGDAPILRRNRVLAQVAPLHTQDFEQGAKKIRANPYLDNNTFEVIGPAVAVGTSERASAGIAPR
jgi:nitrous oxidase accessory protein NosD